MRLARIIAMKFKNLKFWRVQLVKKKLMSDKHFLFIINVQQLGIQLFGIGQLFEIITDKQHMALVNKGSLKR